MRYYRHKSIAFVTQGNERNLMHSPKSLKILNLCIFAKMHKLTEIEFICDCALQNNSLFGV